ncbi:hypothetical protein PsYK624_041800 [Phanerochaete sordida]|uniref:Uncharacterized protein n=1 Tax=Phanerochaete sordida TaxID=48140 RepID=A0A9P3G4S6_9APHY|nr:hypothetical protein PsYK624_041800 [Phanerochaete sordida]
MSASTSPPKALSCVQERKIRDFVEDRFLDLTRNFKKRSEPTSTTVPTLTDYLRQSHTLLSLILQIPSTPPSASLRTTFLLRLTGDVMGAIPGYRPTPDVLAAVLDWLNDLDRGWLAVLRGQEWDSDAREGVDAPPSQPADGDASAQDTVLGSPLSQTERTRLRSLLIGGTARLEEWLTELDTAHPDADYTVVLERMGLQQGFDDLFAGTLTEMGSFGGAVSVPEGMEGTC